MQRDRRDPFGLRRRRVAPNSPQTVRRQAARRLAPRPGPCRRKCVRRAGKSPNMGLGLHRTNMVGHDPEDQKRRPLRRWARRSLVRGVLCIAPSRTMQCNQPEAALHGCMNYFKMTLCGSEVPQDRWRGRTAGSGMWTLTRDNLLSWSLDDPAIPYG